MKKKFNITSMHLYTGKTNREVISTCIVASSSLSSSSPSLCVSVAAPVLSWGRFASIEINKTLLMIDGLVLSAHCCQIYICFVHFWQYLSKLQPEQPTMTGGCISLDGQSRIQLSLQRFDCLLKIFI